MQLELNFKPRVRWFVARMPPHPEGQPWAAWAWCRVEGQLQYMLIVDGRDDRIKAAVVQNTGGFLWSVMVRGTAHRYGVDLYCSEESLAVALAKAQCHATTMASSARREDITGSLE